MKKIDILIPNFEDFGAQRVAINVANGLSSQYEITFIVFADNGPFKSYLNEGIKIIKLDHGFLNVAKLRIIPRFFRYLRHTYKDKTDITIAFSPVANLVILFSKIFNRRLKTIIQEHGYPSLAIKDRQNMGPLLELFFRHVIFRLYNISDIFISITEAIKDDFVKNFGVRTDIIKVVRNPVDIEKISLLMLEPVVSFEFRDGTPYIIGIGRLVDQKNFFRLVRIFAELKKQLPQTELIILGEGPDREGLNKLAAELGVAQSVHLLGFQANPYNFLHRADCYCLSSNWEGLPQVIAEAMICGTAVVANDCKSGPSEMISDNVTGRLIPLNDESAFAAALFELLTDPEKRKSISQAAYDFASREYSIEKCVKNYNDILDILK